MIVHCPGRKHTNWNRRHRQYWGLWNGSSRMWRMLQTNSLLATYTTNNTCKELLIVVIANLSPVCKNWRQEWSPLQEALICLWMKKYPRNASDQISQACRRLISSRDMGWALASRIIASREVQLTTDSAHCRQSVNQLPRHSNRNRKSESSIWGTQVTFLCDR